MNAHAVVRALTLLPLLAMAPGEVIVPGAWRLTSTVSEAAIPGVSQFIVGMVTRRPKVEMKCVPPDALDPGMARLLAPNPAGKCTLDRNEVAGGRFTQVMTCPHRIAGTLQVVRVGRYDATGYSAQVTMTGVDPKRRARIVAAMEARSTGEPCRPR